MEESDLGLDSGDRDHDDDIMSPEATDGFDSKSDSRPAGLAANSDIDAAELSEALLAVEDSRQRSREHTPGASPSRKRQRRIYGDRWVMHIHLSCDKKADIG